ncbi:MAG: RNA methyltransferase [Anaerolineales bacterium]|nr:RNA methyltransferase [Anaerolineales bacterium]
MQSETIWLEGHISVTAAIQGGFRTVTAVYLGHGKWSRQVAALKRLALACNIPVEQVDESFIADRVSGNSHGGVIAEAGPRKFMGVADLITGQQNPFIVMLDGIEDPFNFGQAVRTLYAAGANGLVVRPRNWMTAGSIVARASAGAAELIPTAVAETAVDAATYFRSFGLQIVTTTKKSTTTLYAVDLSGPLFILIGGERRGVTRSFLEQADLRLQIPYGRQFGQSLGAAASAAVLGFEIMRQRNQPPTA